MAITRCGGGELHVNFPSYILYAFTYSATAVTDKVIHSQQTFCVYFLVCPAGGGVWWRPPSLGGEIDNYS